MKHGWMLRDARFQAVADIKVDAKHRISLGRLTSERAGTYRVYRNEAGQLLLDPMVAVPAQEAWLFRNPQAAAMVKEGLEQARAGKLANAKEDYRKHLRERA